MHSCMSNLFLLISYSVHATSYFQVVLKKNYIGGAFRSHCAKCGLIADSYREVGAWSGHITLPERE